MAATALAYSPPPCPALDAILALDESSLPYTDNKPMADAGTQAQPLHYSREAIRDHLRDEELVAVDSDMFVHYLSRGPLGEPAYASVAPDVFVVFGVPWRLHRPSYVLWREPEADLRFVLEIASPSTRRHDHTGKRDIYASLGVREYFLFDPQIGRRPAAILGLRLGDDGRYREMPTTPMPDGRLGVASEVVGLVAHVEGEKLLWFDPTAGADILEPQEARDWGRTQARRRVIAERESERQRRRADDAERLAETAGQRIKELEAMLRAHPRRP